MHTLDKGHEYSQSSASLKGFEENLFPYSENIHEF